MKNKIFDTLRHLPGERFLHIPSHDKYTHYFHEFRKNSPEQQKILRLLQKKSSLSSQEIAAELNFTENQTIENLKSLEENSWIIGEGNEPRLFKLKSVDQHPKTPESDNAKDLRSTVKRRVAYNLRFQAASIVLGYIVAIIWAKNLGLHHFGFYSIAGTVATLLALILPFGLNTVSTFFLPVYIKDQKWALYRGLLFSSYKFVTLLSALLLLLGSLSTLIFNIPIYYKYVFLLTIGWGICSAYQALISSQLEGQKRFVSSYFLSIFLQPVLVLAGIGILYSYGVKLHTLVAVEITFAAQLILLAITVLVFIFGHKPAFQKVSPQYDKQNWRKFSISAGLMAIFVILINRVDLLVIDMLMNHSSAGIYMAVLLTSAFLALPFQAFKSSINPTIAQLAHTKRYDLLQDLETYSARRCLLLTLILAVILITYANPLLDHFGDHQAQGYVPFLILAFAWIILSVIGSPGYIMLISGKQKKYLTILISCTCLNLILQFIFVARFGLTGAALSSAFCLCLNRALGAIAAHKDCKIHTSILGVGPWPDLSKVQEKISNQSAS